MTDREMRKAFLLNLLLTRLLLKFSNMSWEYKLGVNTRGVLYTRATSDSVPYGTVSYLMTMEILRKLCLKPLDVFVDIGCGKGRVLCCASQFKIREVIGVEIDKSLCEKAQQNAEKVRSKKSPIRIINADVQEFDYQIGTVYYLFNPFGAATLNQVLARIRESLQLQPRKVRIVYVNPVAESMLQKSDCLEMYDRWRAGKKFGLVHDVSFWKSKSL